MDRSRQRRGPRDVIVIVPGFLGSELWSVDENRIGPQLWGPKGVFATAVRSGLRSSETIERLTDSLALADPDDPQSVPPLKARPLASQAIIPGFWSVEGYDHLERYLSRRFGDRVVSFGYDWRLSNRVSAERLARFVEPLVRDARRDDPQAGVIFVCHSMGGLVARWYAEMVDHHQLTRGVITLGTPYRGAVKALAALANGEVKAGLRRLAVGELLASWPSVTELLPTYNCLCPTLPLKPRDVNPEDLIPLPVADIGQLSARQIEKGFAFHSQLAERIDRSLSLDRYFPLAGCVQATPDWAVLNNDGTVETYGWVDPGWHTNQGDGTVPRRSASPPEWGDPPRDRIVVSRHAAMQFSRGALQQIEGIIDGLNPGAPKGGAEMWADAPPLVEAGQGLMVEVGGVDLRAALDATLLGEDGSEIAVERLTPSGDETLVATFSVDDPGFYRWRVAVPDEADEPQYDTISDVVVCATAER